MRWRSPCGSTLCLGASVLERLQRSRSRDRSSERTLLGSLSWSHNDPAGVARLPVAANDWQAKSYVRDAYECARDQATPEFGLFGGEGCTAGDVVALAIQLTDAGVGDYWDDVDHYFRNGLIEFRIVDGAELERMKAVRPGARKRFPLGAATEWRFGAGIQRSSFPGQECTDHVTERMVGSFGCVENVSPERPMMMADPIGTGSQGLYYGWEAIVRYADHHAGVNLSVKPAVDVESSLPPEGEVTLGSKSGRGSSLRLSGLGPSSVRPAFEINGAPRLPRMGWARYATIGNLHPGPS